MNLKEKVITLIPIILIFLFLYIILYSVEFYLENDIKDTLIYVIPVFLSITFILMILSFVWGLKDLRKLFKKIDRKTWIAFLIIFLIGLSLRTFVAPHTHNIYFDEHVYLNVGQNIANEGKGALTWYGTPEKCFEHYYIKQPIGYPFFISIVFNLFGTSESNAHYATAVISSLTILTVFFISYLIFENEKISIFSTLIFTLTPISIIWAPTTSSDTVFIFFMALTVFGFLSYFKNSKKSILLFSFLSLAYTIQIRPEGLILLFLILFLFILFEKNLFATINKKHFLAILLIFSILIIPHLLHTNIYREHSWDNQQGEKFEIKYIGENIDDNSFFFFENTRFPVVFTILSIIGLLFGRMWKKKTLLAIWFIIFFGIYLLFYAGSFNYNIDVRYSLTLYIQLAILGGCGAYVLMGLIKRITKKRSIAFLLMFLVIIFAFIPFYNNIMLYKEQDSYSDALRPADVFFRQRLSEIEEDSWVFTELQHIAIVNGRKALKPFYAEDAEVVSKIFRETDNVYFFSYSGKDPFGLIFDFMDSNFNLVECEPKHPVAILYKIEGWK